MKRLTDGTADDDYPTWSPDGRVIAFQRESADGTMHIFTTSPDGSSLTQVTHSGDPCGEPAWQAIVTGS